MFADHTLTNTGYCIARVTGRPPEQFRMSAQVKRPKFEPDNLPPKPPTIRPSFGCDQFWEQCRCGVLISGRTPRGLKIRMQNHQQQHKLTQGALCESVVGRDAYVVD